MINDAIDNAFEFVGNSFTSSTYTNSIRSIDSDVCGIQPLSKEGIVTEVNFPNADLETLKLFCSPLIRLAVIDRFENSIAPNVVSNIMKDPELYQFHCGRLIDRLADPKKYVDIRDDVHCEGAYVRTVFKAVLTQDQHIFEHISDEKGHKIFQKLVDANDVDLLKAIVTAAEKNDTRLTLWIKPTRTNRNAQTPLDIAKAKGRHELVELFENHIKGQSDIRISLR